MGLILGFQLTQISVSPEHKYSASNAHFLNINFQQPKLDQNLDLLNPFGGNIAIILQGAVGKNPNSLTLLISRYRNLYPSAHIIFSTWSDEKTEFLRETDHLHLVKSVKPRNPGISNINLQLISTQAGIELAEKLGCDYVIKSRSDQMLLNSTFLINLHHLAEEYLSEKKKPRIVISSFNTFCFRKYSISDMFTFGDLAEMRNFWFIPLDTRSLADISSIDFTEKDVWCKLRLAENYISCHYLEKRGLVLNFTYAQYYKALSEYFIVVDANELGQAWTKYTAFNPIYNLNNFPHSRSEVTSTIWKSLPALSEVLASAANRIENN